MIFSGVYFLMSLILCGALLFIFPNFCRFIEREERIPLQWGGQTIQERIKEEVSDLFSKNTMAEWLELLYDKGICFSPILSIEETLNFPHLRVRGMFQGIEGERGKTVPQVGLPIKLSNTPPAYSISPPRMGQDS